MILLLGGTTETAPLAGLLAQAGYQVLVSTATEIAMELPAHENVSRRSGLLDFDRMLSLVRSREIRAVVDATHPYAAEVTRTAQRVCREAALPYLCLVRPPSARDESFVHFARDHEEAAKLACGFGKPVLLTVGTRNLEAYVGEARNAGCALFARVLADERSLEACRAVGIAADHVIAGRGPFSTEENRAELRARGIGVLVTKDSGVAGGVPAKIEAARKERCRVVVVRRPQIYPADACRTVEELVDRCLGEVAT